MNGSIQPAASAGEQIFDRMGILSDATRGRLLLLLEGHDLAVGELCRVLQQPQSTVSRHLKLLADDGWLGSWRDGTSRRYRMEVDRLDASARGLWELVREQIRPLPAARQDRDRLRSVLADRRTRSQEFFSSTAGEWDRVRRELFGAGAETAPLLGLLAADWVVGDLGCGTGQTAGALAPFVGRVIAVDESEEMLAAARRRLAAHGNVELRRGSLEALPIADGALDAALLVLVLHHLADPPAALAEAARALAPGGRLLVVDMLPHDRERYRQEMGHLWLGFSAEQLRGWLAAAGFAPPRTVALAPDPEAKGPNLFAATAIKPQRSPR
jgi:ubiquinone/menaquinone biosynthesis C-methylase UbiE/DNA-binding transcriptional ArsR family regulator